MMLIMSPALAQQSLAQDQTVSETVMSRTERIEQAHRALERGDYQLALAQADALLERWPRDENGLIVRAAVLLFGPKLDAGEAGRMLRRLPRARREEADVEALDLWKDYRHGFNFMPTIRERLQMDRARELLERDPTDPIANLVAGMMRVQDQRYLDNAVRVISPAGEEGLVNQLFYEARAVLDPSTGLIRFSTDHSGAGEVQILRENDQMREASDEAVRYLIRAAATGPLHTIAVRALTEAAIRGGRVRDAELLLSEYVARHPDTMEGYLYLGLVRYMLMRDEMAAEAFDQALAMMPLDNQFPWLHPRSVVSTDLIPAYQDVGMGEIDDFWIRQDREWSRPGNERLVEHMGRMAYADLIWGREEDNLRGWEVEPGQVLIRYGFPQDRLQFQTSEPNGGDRYHLLHYGSRYWIFQDLVKAGKSIFYTPPADYHQGGRAVIGEDWALMAKEQFRDNPVESDLDGSGRLEMEVMASLLENGMDRVVVSAACIRGTAFGAGSWVRQFERVVGAPVPTPSDSVQVTQMGRCPSFVTQQRVDGRAHQLSLETRSGHFWSVGRIDVPALVEDGSIRTSDVVLANLIEEYEPGDPVLPLAFERNGVVIHPVAEARYQRGSPLYLYSEAYNLDDREGDVLVVEAVLVEGGTEDVEPSLLGRVFGRRDDAAVSVSFEDEIVAVSQGRYLIMETADLSPGLYTLALRITERASGRQAVARREIRID